MSRTTPPTTTDVEHSFAGPNGPTVTYPDGMDADEVESNCPFGWRPDWETPAVRLGDGRWRAPLVLAEPEDVEPSEGRVMGAMFALISELRAGGRAVSTALEVDAVVSAVVASWRDRDRTIEATAREGVAIVDLVMINKLIARHNLCCTRGECSAELRRLCASHVWGR